MQLKDFLDDFFEELRKSNIHYCILRNYENLPQDNRGTDVDFLIPESDFSAILSILDQFEKIKITGVLTRQYLHSVFLYGISWKEYGSIQLDFVTHLAWKGQTFLDAGTVLKNRMDYKNFFIPSPLHEAIISLLMSFLYGNFIKEKYIGKVQEVFGREEKRVSEELTTWFGEKTAKRLIHYVNHDELGKLLEAHNSVKFHLIVHGIKTNPFNGFARFWLYFQKEFLIRFGKKRIVVFLGPDGAGKSTIISRVKDELNHAARPVEVIHLRRSLRKRAVENFVAENPHAQKPRGYFASFLKLIYWALEYQADHLINRPRALTLCLYDRYYHDLLIDPKRYRYKGGNVFVRFFSLFVPKPMLWVVLTAPPEVLHSRKKEIPYEETVRQIEKYREFHERRPNSLFVDTSQPLETTVQQISEHIANAMNRHVKL